ncbi:MAG: heme exporter protein CcmD [Stellaceae bacterium]|jgi:heme exporter protein D
MATFFAMGGYARFVWPAYAVAALVLLGLLFWSLARYRRIKIQLAAREAKSPRRRKQASPNL